MKRILTVLLCCILAASLTACAQQENTPTAAASESTDSDATYGKVTQTDGNEIVIALGTMDVPEMDSRPSGIPQDGQPPEQPSGAPYSAPDASASGQPDEIPSGAPGNAPPDGGGMGEGFTESGETLTVTLSEVTLTKQSSPEETAEASAADIAAGDIVKLEGSYESGAFNVTGITILSTGNPGSRNSSNTKDSGI